MLCIISNYIILIWLKYKWEVDGLSLKKIKANIIFNPVLYYILSPYNGKKKGKRKHKEYELGLIIFEIACNLFALSMIIDTLFLKDFMWNLKGWSAYIYFMIVPIVGVAYMIIAEIVKKQKINDYIKIKAQDECPVL